MNKSMGSQMSVFGITQVKEKDIEEQCEIEKTLLDYGLDPQNGLKCLRIYVNQMNMQIE